MEIDVSKPFHLGCNSFVGWCEKGLTEVAEYAGQSNVRLVCTQLGSKYSASAQKRILQEWCEFFCGKSKIEELMVECRTPVPLFEAICQHKSIKRLRIKWGPVVDLRPLANLRNMESLDLGTTSVKDLSPLASLTKLRYLKLDNFKHVKDFVALGQVTSLQFLNVVGYPPGPQKIHMRNLSFLSRLTKLRALAIEFVILDDFSLDPLLSLKRLEFLNFDGLSSEHCKRVQDALPKLKYGNACN